MRILASSSLIAILLSLFISSCTTSKYLYKDVEFEFSKDLVYSGKKSDLLTPGLLQSGFSHIDVLSLTNPNSIPNSKKYILWSGVAYEDRKSPWSLNRDPFGNDINFLRSRWIDRLQFYGNRYRYSYGNELGIVLMDFERKFTKSEIKKKGINFSKYTTKMRELYTEPLMLAKNKRYAVQAKLGSYSDVPIERVFWQIPEQTWEEWITDISNLNYITHSGGSETTFSKNLDFYSISGYYYYSHEHNNPSVVNSYLPYMLFQVEANQEWSDYSKPIYLSASLRFQGTKEFNDLIYRDMLFNTVIFSYMSGVEGLVLYDDLKETPMTDDYLSLIDGVVEATGLLAEYDEYFDGTSRTRLFKPTNPRDIFVDRLPCVRGIIKGDKVLLAAINTYGKDNEKYSLDIEIQNKVVNIELEGKNLFFKEIILE